MLSDIFDGVIARRLKIATAPLRVMDSRADAWFFIWVVATAWAADKTVLISVWIPITIEIVLQVASYTYDLIRYGRISSLHAYSAKLWGFTLYLAFVGVLAFHTGALVWVALVFGLISFADATAIKTILPGWHHDVLSCFHAKRQAQVNAESG
jgi:CDP-diacylglycerol--glycerol-3-phosphate 3-phosphatidyltransferase